MLEIKDTIEKLLDYSYKVSRIGEVAEGDIALRLASELSAYVNKEGTDLLQNISPIRDVTTKQIIENLCIRLQNLNTIHYAEARTLHYAIVWLTDAYVHTERRGKVDE